MNKSQFANASGLNDVLATRWFSHIKQALHEFSITDTVAQAMFIAQVGHESAGFSVAVESLNYSAAGLLSVFGKYFTEVSAQIYGRTADHPADQKGIANIVYANRMGNTSPDDGWNYRGRGLIQLTGRYNYTDCGNALGDDLVNNPDLLAEDKDAARSAAWYWHARGCDSVAADIKAVTRLINGGLNGLSDRQQRFDRAKAILVR
ncbi:endolysin [Erwinia typographi]|uniref:Endolysin n=1 Tax=Erwinia typographi TaxID=371042 RepID=A0A0A3YLC5_9GAMM|nr:endolysin [Erwinia typographi]